MSAAAFVGRVGGLAVALGVGSAIFAGTGVAWADGTGSSSTKSSTSASTDAVKKPTKRPAKNASGDTANTESPAKSDKPAKATKADKPARSDRGTKADDASKDTAGTADEATPEDANAPQDRKRAKPSRRSTSSPEAATSSKPSPKIQPATALETILTPKRSRTSASTTAAADAKAINDTTASDPAEPPQAAKTVTLFTAASSPAADTTAAGSSSKKPNLVTAVVNVVHSMLDWAHQKADAGSSDPAPPPLLWALLSFTRRELETLVASRNTVSAASTATAASTSLALSDVSAAAAAATYSPWANPQVSPSTNFVAWVTGNYVYGDKTLANTLNRFQVYGTDVGTMWDNGMTDLPGTAYDEHQLLIATGDTFGAVNMTGRHIYNTLFRSSDTDLSDGMTIRNGEWFNGNMFGGAPLSSPTQARPIINRPPWAPNSVTLIPTAGVSVNVPVTKDTPYGTIQYVTFMSVSNWGSSGRWTTNYAAIAYSTDNGENFTVDQGSVRYNSFLSGNKNFQQSAFVKGDDGYIYMYGTPNGRQGAAYVARVAPDDILDLSKYQYYKAASTSWFGTTTEAQWVTGRPQSATPIIGKSGGFLGRLQPGYTVSEMSVQYNEYLGKYIVLYGDQSNRIVMRTADSPEGVWSDPTVLMTQQPGGIYAPMLNPWSPSTLGTGPDLYWNLSLWSAYDIMEMHTDLSKV